MIYLLFNLIAAIAGMTLKDDLFGRLARLSRQIT